VRVTRRRSVAEYSARETVWSTPLQGCRQITLAHTATHDARVAATVRDVAGVVTAKGTDDGATA
jgi:hypothetical protein